METSPIVKDIEMLEHVLPNTYSITSNLIITDQDTFSLTEYPDFLQFYLHLMAVHSDHQCIASNYNLVIFNPHLPLPYCFLKVGAAYCRSGNYFVHDMTSRECKFDDVVFDNNFTAMSEGSDGLLPSSRQLAQHSSWSPDPAHVR